MALRMIAEQDLPGDAVAGVAQRLTNGGRGPLRDRRQVPNASVGWPGCASSAGANGIACRSFSASSRSAWPRARPAPHPRPGSPDTLCVALLEHGSSKRERLRAIATGLRAALNTALSLGRAQQRLQVAGVEARERASVRLDEGTERRRRAHDGVVAGGVEPARERHVGLDITARAEREDADTHVRSRIDARAGAPLGTPCAGNCDGRSAWGSLYHPRGEGLPRLALPLGPRVVPHVRGVPRAARRRGRSRARARRGRSRLPLPARRPDDRARGLPRGAARARARSSGARSRDGPRRDRPVVRAARLAAAVGRGARAQPARGTPRGRARSGRCSTRRPTRPTRSAIPRSCRRSSRASASRTFVYWRGNGDEIDRRCRAEYAGRRPTAAPSLALPSRATATSTPPATSRAIRRRGRRRDSRDAAPRSWPRARAVRVLLMNGFDHALPERTTRRASRARSARSTGCDVQRALLEDFVDARLAARAPASSRRAASAARSRTCCPACGRRASRSSSRNRALRSRAARGWAEPWAALGRSCSARPTSARRCAPRGATLLREPGARLDLRLLARRACTTQMCARFDAARGARARDDARAASSASPGSGAERRTPLARRARARGLQSVAASAHRRRARSRSIRYPSMHSGASGRATSHPLRCCARAPARASRATARPRASCPADDPAAASDALPERRRRDVEFVVARRAGVRLAARARSSASAEAAPDVDRRRPRDRRRRRARSRAARRRHARRRASAAQLRGPARARGRRRPRRQLRLRSGRAESRRSRRVERRAPPARERASRGCASRACSRVPARARRDRASAARGARGRSRSRLDARVAPGVPRVDVAACALENTADDHRLRLLFPTGRRVAAFAPPRPSTSCAHDARRADARLGAPARRATSRTRAGCARAGSRVVAPGLPEAEVSARRRDRAHARARGRAGSRAHDLRTRPVPAGPGSSRSRRAVPGRAGAELRLLDARGSARCRLGRARDRGSAPRPCRSRGTPLVPKGVALVALAPRALVLSALKPARARRGPRRARAEPRPARACAPCCARASRRGCALVRLDESDTDVALETTLDSVTFEVPPHALRTVRLVASGTR